MKPLSRKGGRKVFWVNHRSLMVVGKSKNGNLEGIGKKKGFEGVEKKGPHPRQKRHHTRGGGLQHVAKKFWRAGRLGAKRHPHFRRKPLEIRVGLQERGKAITWEGGRKEGGEGRGDKNLPGKNGRSPWGKQTHLKRLCAKKPKMFGK